MNETRDVLAAVEAVLADTELKDSPRAFLLVRLCQLSLLFAPDKMETYWNRLAPVEKRTPQEAQPQLGELRELMESTSEAKAKGFAAEVIADIEVAKGLAESDVEGAKQGLRDCETRLKKRRMPFGKAAAWIALVEAWAPIDRQYAFQLIGNMPRKVQASFVQRMNRADPLLAEEWETVADKVGMAKAVEVALEILDSEKPQLNLPEKVLLEVGGRIRNSMQSPPTPKGEAELGKALGQYAKLVGLQVDGPNARLIPTLLEEMYVFLAKTNTLDQIWPVRFALLTSLLATGIATNSFSPEAMDGLLKKTPPFLVNFVQAHYLGLKASADDVEETYGTLLTKTGEDPEAEAWFLVTVAKRGLPARALALAERSAHAADLLPRLRRAWLSLAPEAASTVISAADMAGDAIGEFLVQGDVPSRVTYLVEATNAGTRGVPGAMWAGKGTEEEAEGLRGFWSSLTAKRKTHDEIIQEYLTLNPLYSSYRRDTPKERQFSDYVRIHGYGEYQYANVDNALLQTLVAWGDREPAQVQSLLRAMWHAVQPDDQILMVDWLRNAILTRCRNVFSADPETLEQDFLGWLGQELVKKGRVWQVGNTQITLKYPDTALFQFCVAAAAAVGGLSPARRDRILVSGLGKFKADPQMVEAAAQLYNADKEVLDLAPPIQLAPNLVEAWQLGIVKNAIPKLLNAMAASASS